MHFAYDPTGRRLTVMTDLQTPVATAEPRRAPGYAAMVVGATSNQAGAATGALAFDAIGPPGVVAVRQFVAAAVLVPLTRPPWRQMTWSQWWPALSLGLVFAGMNLGLYTAIDRIGLGLAVTLEFLGPLAVALGSSRRGLDVLGALLAGLGVYVLVLPSSSTDLIGVASGLFAAACWAAYILLNRTLGTRLPGLQAPAVAACAACVLTTPIVIHLVIDGRFTGAALGAAVAAGVLASVVPYCVDLFALRRVPPGAFGLFSSIHPVLAALAGMIILGQTLRINEFAGIVLIVLANVMVIGAQARARRVVLAPDVSRRHR